MKKRPWYRKLFLRRALVILAMMLQVWLMVDILLDLSRYSPLISTIHSLSSFAVAIYIASRRNKSAFKTSWIVLVLVFPCLAGSCICSSISRVPPDDSAGRSKRHKRNLPRPICAPGIEWINAWTGSRSIRI